jgi:hypothetical protein
MFTIYLLRCDKKANKGNDVRGRTKRTQKNEGKEAHKKRYV